LLFLLLPGPRASGGPTTDPFDFLEPAVQLSDEDRHRIDGRSVIVRILPASGHEVATLAAGSLSVGPDVLLASVRNIVQLKKSPLVPQIGRFSAPPQLEDLRTLTLDNGDVDEIRRCGPERCGLKLEPAEIARLQQAFSSASANPRAALEQEFRRVVLERANEYLRRGEHRNQREFSLLLEHSPHFQSLPQLHTYLQRYPATPLPDAEAFLYWSKETYAWKPMISVTHVAMVRGAGEGGLPEAMIATRDVFATRYTSGSVVLTLLLRDQGQPSQRYLVYLNRTWIDGLRGLWRPFVEHRIKSQAKGLFAAARDQIERMGVMNTSAR
jgi:hypothetical protein